MQLDTLDNTGVDFKHQTNTVGELGGSDATSGVLWVPETPSSDDTFP